jgi:hypothetical protein
MSILNIRLFAALMVLSLFLSAQVLAEEAPPIEPAPLPLLIDLTKMTKIGSMTTLGVEAKAYITTADPNEVQKATHKVVVTFTNKKTGVAVQKALVGIKYRRLYGSVSEPVWMHSTADQSELFISDVTLERKGTYLFIVGSKLEDDKKRQFTFQY